MPHAVRGSLNADALVRGVFLLRGCRGDGFMAYGMFDSISPHSDTAADGWIALGSFWSVLSVGAVIGGIWVLRHWPGRSI